MLVSQSEFYCNFQLFEIFQFVLNRGVNQWKRKADSPLFATKTSEITVQRKPKGFWAVLEMMTSDAAFSSLPALSCLISPRNIVQWPIRMETFAGRREQ